MRLQAMIGEQYRIRTGVHIRTAWLFAPVDNASIVCFRVLFGALLFWDVCRYFAHDWIRQYYIQPSFFFTYPGIEWVRPWSGDGMYLHFLALGILAICITLGIAYRLSMSLFFVGFTYVFLLDKARYLNHFYLICLLSFLLIFVPAHRAFSFDAWRNPNLRSNVAPRWSLWLLRSQLAIVYFFGGIAKLNGDWLRGDPMRLWLGERTNFPILGQWFTQDWAAYFFSYGGLLFDLCFVPFILWPRTRIPALIAGLTFHLLNSRLFDIGVFPWMMIAATVLLLPPSWSRRLFRRSAPSTASPLALPSRNQQLFIAACLSAYLVIQCIIPLRHFLYPGNVNWTEDGHRFSWHMKLRDKQGTARFFVTDVDSDSAWEIDPMQYLSDNQFEEMVSRPDMLYQFSRYVIDDLRRQGYTNIEFYVWDIQSLNGRTPQLLVDHTMDLARYNGAEIPQGWVIEQQD